jgi:hypothetical protein
LTLDRTFVTLTPNSLSKLVFGAKRRVVYAAPSLTRLRQFGFSSD